MENEFEKAKKELMDFLNKEDYLPLQQSYLFAIKIDNDLLKLIYYIDENDYGYIPPDLDYLMKDSVNNFLLVQQTYKVSKWYDKYIDEILLPVKGKRYITRNDENSLFIGFLYNPLNCFELEMHNSYFNFDNRLVKEGDKIIKLYAADYCFFNFDGTKYDKSIGGEVHEDGTAAAEIFLCFEYESYKWDYIGEIDDEKGRSLLISLEDSNSPIDPLINNFIE